MAREIQSAVVVGAGTMGAGIAIACANAGLPTWLTDSSAEALERGRQRIDDYYQRQVERGKLASTAAEALRRNVVYAAELGATASADLAIEAAFEDLAVKREVFARLGEALAADALLATNTSTLDVDAIGGAAPHPERTLGLHFFSPAHVMKLVEIVRGRATAPETIDEALALCKRLGKIAVVVGNCDGFVGNRMLLGYRREAEFLLLEGVPVERIDGVLEGFGFAMGPFAVSDLAGIDIGWRAKMERKRRGSEPPFALTDIADALVAAGRLGQKSGAGYYRYASDRTRAPDPAALGPLLTAERRRLSVLPRGVSDEEIVERCVYALVMEGGRILDEGVAASADDIDTIWLNGYGFPRERGGPMSYARSVGLAHVREAIARFAERDPAFWRPSTFLEGRAGA